MHFLFVSFHPGSSQPPQSSLRQRIRRPEELQSAFGRSLADLISLLAPNFSLIDQFSSCAYACAAVSSLFAPSNSELVAFSLSSSLSDRLLILIISQRQYYFTRLSGSDLNLLSLYCCWRRWSASLCYSLKWPLPQLSEDYQLQNLSLSRQI